MPSYFAGEKLGAALLQKAHGAGRPLIVDPQPGSRVMEFFSPLGSTGQSRSARPHPNSTLSPSPISREVESGYRPSGSIGGTQNILLNPLSLSPGDYKGGNRCGCSGFSILTHEQN
jgi:hypothetical protein